MSSQNDRTTNKSLAEGSNNKNKIQLLIQSESNEKFKVWKSLLTSKGIKKEGLALLSGVKLTKEFLEHSANKINAILMTAEYNSTSTDSFSFSDFNKASSANNNKKHSSEPSIFILDKKLFAELDELGTHQPLYVIKTPEIKPWTMTKNKGLTLFLPLSNPGNLGAAVRSASSFGVNQIVLLKESANPFLPKSLKGSAGSVLTAPLFAGPSMAEISELTEGHQLLGLDMSGEPLHTLQWPQEGYLIVGEEGLGLKKVKNLKKISIPIKNTESLNATVALSIALYDWSLKNKK